MHCRGAETSEIGKPLPAVCSTVAGHFQNSTINAFLIVPNAFLRGITIVGHVPDRKYPTHTSIVSEIFNKIFIFRSCLARTVVIAMKSRRLR